MNHFPAGNFGVKQRLRFISLMFSAPGITAAGTEWLCRLGCLLGYERFGLKSTVKQIQRSSLVVQTTSRHTTTNEDDLLKSSAVSAVIWILIDSVSTAQITALAAWQSCSACLQSNTRHSSSRARHEHGCSYIESWEIWPHRHTYMTGWRWLL